MPARVKSLHRIAFIACVIAATACQGTTSPAPSARATAVRSTSTPAASTPPNPGTPAPTGQVLARSDSVISNASINTLIATGDGFVASGWSETSLIMASGSADGRSWQALAGDDVFHHVLNGIAAGPLGWVAAESIDTPDGAGIGAVLWHSDDGRTWFQVPDQADLGTSFPGPVFAGPWGFAMFGQAVDANGTSAHRLWVSRDGLAWRQMPGVDLDIGQIVALPGGFLALGPERASFTADGLAWVDVGPLPADPVVGDATAASLGSDVFAMFSGAHGATVWRGTIAGSPSQPSITWQDVGLEMAPGAVTLVALAAGPLGALALGFDRETLRPITWASGDGRTWQRTDLDASAFGGGVPTIAAVGNGAFVVLGWFGNEGGDVVARPWTSTDGLAWEGAEPEQLGRLPGLPSEPCPSGTPTDASQLVAMAGSYPSIPSAVWPYCFGDRELVLRGYVGDCGGCGGETPYVAVPDWLLEPLGYAQFWLLGSPPAEGRGLSISVQIDPKHPVAVPKTGAHVRVTGHFDDPAAQQCRLVPAVAGMTLPSAGVTIATCRQQFVVTAIKVLPD